jgi:hypothetical protein
MAQRGDGPGLTLKAFDEVRVALEIGMEYLHGHVALEVRVQGLPDLCHASSSQALV